MPAYNLAMQELSHPYPAPGNGTVSGHQVELMYHHIVPKSPKVGLIWLWNAVLEDKVLAAATPVLNAIIQNVDKYGTTLVPTDRQQVKDLATGIKNKTITHQAGAARPTGWDSFAQIYIWLPGNLFTGPRNRADDPGDKFDAAVRFIIGASSAQYKTLETVDAKIAQYAKDRKKTGYAEEAYTNLGTVARTYLTRTPFSSPQWTWDSGKNKPKVKGS
ncbi:hypothetical protein ACFC0M_21805 [Streptomyces sp. NPDC056149]|uniref:hypothetical protein n=1 Tax=unclassified Streptomyces TaxID=2593676 RepID=UPI0023812AB0|nr:hypothetical protein [Streptomyces sp. WZ-12]